MLLRLRLYSSFLKLAIYLLPFPAFEIGWRIWALCMAFLDRPIAYTHNGNFTLVLFSSFLWAFMAEHYKVTKGEASFRERTGATAASAAKLATDRIFMTVL